LHAHTKDFAAKYGELARGSVERANPKPPRIQFSSMLLNHVFPVPPTSSSTIALVTLTSILLLYSAKQQKKSFAPASSPTGWKIGDGKA
jgi:hypothetical protein